MKPALVLAVLSFSIPVCAEIDDEEAKVLARQFLARIDPSFAPRNWVVHRMQPREEYPWIDVYADEVVIALSYDGAFSSYHDMRRVPNPEESARFFLDDESAWRAAEHVLSRFDLPEGLVRNRITRTAGSNVQIPTVQCKFDVKPYGYWSSAGNTASVTYEQINGKLRDISISGGWTYESPNIRISGEEAKAKSQEIYGGRADEWRITLDYTVGANRSFPRYMRDMAANKIQRLCYTLGRDKYMVVVDSVTGQVITHGGFMGVPEDIPSKLHVSGEDEEQKAIDQPSSDAEERGMAPTYLRVGLGGLLLLAAMWLGRKLITRK